MQMYFTKTDPTNALRLLHPNKVRKKLNVHLNEDCNEAGNWCTLLDLNQRLSPCHGDTLPTELRVL